MWVNDWEDRGEEFVVSLAFVATGWRFDFDDRAYGAS